jgi:hypothetical protein
MSFKDFLDFFLSKVYVSIHNVCRGQTGGGEEYTMYVWVWVNAMCVCVGVGGCVGVVDVSSWQENLLSDT